MEVAEFSTIEKQRDGRTIEVRALRPADRSGLLAALGSSSARSRYLRFFSPKQQLTESEVTYFLDVDFATHVALVAVEDAGRGAIVGGSRYIVIRPGQAEVAFFVADHCQGRGIGSALMTHLAAIGRNGGLSELTAEVLAENTAMLRVFEKSVLPMRTTREANLVHVFLQLG
jgi:RimJ/RimL family protein N-acetyltransferase